MSDQQVTDQEPQPKAKHPGGRPKKPKPPPPLPSPMPYSLEETVVLGDEAARKPGVSPASQLRWYSERAQIVRDMQAKADAARHDALEVDNKRLQERIQVLESTKQSLENELRTKDRDLLAARAENDKMAAQLKEMAQEHAKELDESTNKIRANERKAKDLLALVRCVCFQMKDHSEDQRIQYAARLMRFSKQAFKEAQRLAELVKNAEAHRDRYATFYRNLPQGPVEQKYTSEQFAQLMRMQEEKIEACMRADWERLGFESANMISDEVMNQAFELLGVTRKQVERLNTDEEERKA